MKHFGHQSKRQQRKLVEQFRTVSQNFVLLLASVLQYTPNVSWTIQRTLLWVLSIWTLFGVCVNSLTQKRRRLMGILQQLQIPHRLTWQWWTQNTVVYMRLDLMYSEFYIGATEATVFDREQSRTRKFRQLIGNQLAYYEPALKLWYRLDNFYRFACFPIKSCSTDTLFAAETAYQRLLRPQYNWPWINPMLKRHRIGRQKFGPALTRPYLERGRKFCRRYLKRSSARQMCILGRAYHSTEQIYNLLHRLGSDTIEKFHVSRLLRSGQSDTRFIFLLWRLSHQLGEPFRTRCQSQLRLVFKFRHTEAPPANIPMRLHMCSDDMVSAIKDWVLNFTFHHAINFPPFHKVRAPFVRIKSKSLGRYMYNFRSHLTWWTPDTTGQCCCHLFPEHIQTAKRQTMHITAFASDCFPNVPILQAHMGDELMPTWNMFFYKNTEQFERWLKQWKLSPSLIQYWEEFLRDLWEQQIPQSSGWNLRMVREAQKRLEPFVVSPADHYPHSLTLHCPVQWLFLVSKTFLDQNVFRRCQTRPLPLLQIIQQNVPEWIWKSYRWGLHFKAALSTAYILPKPTRDFQKARPIVDYSHSWCKPLGNALASVLYEILQVVYSSLLEHQDIRSVLAATAQLFDQQDYTFGDLYLKQEDIAGFYNQVDHDRMIQAVSFAVHRFCEFQSQTLESVLNVHQDSTERQLRTFRGYWRSRGKKYRPMQLGHIAPLSHYLLSNSFFSVGCIVFQQHRGASMGSQWAPIFCSAVALMREWTFHHHFRVFRTHLGFHHRYVDNRILLHTHLDTLESGHDLFWKLDFYSSPILLEAVPGNEALGYHIDTHQQTITLQLPWNKALRTTRGHSVTQTILSGLLARIRLILTNAYPPSLRLSQIQDLLGLMSMRDPQLLTSTTVRNSIIALVNRYCPENTSHDLFRYA